MLIYIVPLLCVSVYLYSWLTFCLCLCANLVATWIGGAFFTALAEAAYTPSLGVQEVILIVIANSTSFIICKSLNLGLHLHLGHLADAFIQSDLQ